MAAITITPANLVPSANAIRFNGVAAETITQGQALYQLAAGTYGKCDNNLTLLAATFVGIAESAGSAGQTISILRSDPALVLGGTLITGTAVCTSPTAGGLTITPADNTTGSFVTVIGMATSATTLNFGSGFLSSTAI